ncbi:Nup133p [Sugiyamaella lignohabitans]|uniref:Nup133p n=1 Tax=Sugiyamaella lignohabitans TaxID=796027 RepID=A0A167DX18_9ASCO|nr:Nup133p [Sugiyamaella lignohabitans]ANB13395.1 Nup133p [Sugiyamaella lignohabitans]
MDTPSIREIRQSSFRSQAGRPNGRRILSGSKSATPEVIQESASTRPVPDLSLDSNSSNTTTYNNGPVESRINTNSSSSSKYGSLGTSEPAAGESSQRRKSSFRSVSIGSTRQASLRKSSFSEADTNHGRLFEPPKGGALDLTKNTRYCVSKLPATPAVLSGSINLDASDYDSDDVYGGIADQGTNFALVSSPSSAFVWSYTSPEHVPATISFPYDSPDTLTVLVSPAPGTEEPGLVSIVASSGLLTYWESVDGAIANGLLKRRKSVNHEVKLYAGEVIDNIRAIEPAGVIVTTTSGRFVLITLRDLYGKQLVSSVSMRGGGPGLLSSLKSAILPSSSRRGIVSVKPGSITGRTERQVMFINQTGDLSIWECSRGGRSRVLFEGRLHELMLNHISPLYNEAHRTFKVHDVELYEQERCIFVLSSFEYSDKETYYVLFTILIEGNADSTNDVKLLSAHRVQMFTGKSSQPPKLIFPKPYKTLFIVFSEAIVLLDSMNVNVSEARGSVNSATAAVALANGVLRRWEDVITFKSGVEIVGADAEDLIVENAKTIRNCGIIALIRNVGTVRVERFPDEDSGQRSGNLLKRQEALEPELAKSRIEQAVFYGSEDGANPLTFNNRPEIQLDNNILEDSFLQVSKEILETRSIYMPPILPSLSEHLALRVLYLSRLASYLHTNFVRALTTKARFQLLWDLEKATAAKALWGYIDSKLQDDKYADDSLLFRVISKNTRSPSNGDKLRDWFITQVRYKQTRSLDVHKCFGT